MNPCALGQLPEEATSPRTLELMKKASPGLADPIRQWLLEDFQQSGCQLQALGSGLQAPGRLGNPSKAGERPNGESDAKEPFLKKERKSGRGVRGGACMGPQGSVSNFPA